jgi:hypothetical protein
MSDMDLLHGKPYAEAGSTGFDAFRGRVQRPPASTSDDMIVTLDNYTADRPYEVHPGQWAAHGTTLPAHNDIVLAILDDTQDAWVVAWRTP